MYFLNESESSVSTNTAVTFHLYRSRGLKENLRNHLRLKNEALLNVQFGNELEEVRMFIAMRALKVLPDIT